jgi:putative copper export protein
MTPDRLSVTLRALYLVALYQAAGATFFLRLMRARLVESAAGIRRLAFVSAVTGMVLAGLHQWLEAARLADEYRGMIDIDMLRLAWLSGNGAAHAAQIYGLAVLALALGSARSGVASGGTPHLPVAIVGAAIAALALTLTGHSRIHPQRGLFALLLAVHLLVVAFWFGALWPLLRVLRDETPPIAAQIVTRFSTLAGRLVPLILVAGLGMSWLLIAELSVLQRPYGRLLLTKLAGFLLLMPLAAWNKWRLTPALLSGSQRSTSALRRVLAIEYLLICGVLTATANLTAFYSPTE